MQAVLTGTSGQYEGWTFPVHSDRTTIGRENDNALVLKDDRVSRHHAEIRRDVGRLILADLGSRNGTFVNRVRVLAPIDVQAGDEITFGGVTFRLSIVGAGPLNSPPAPLYPPAPAFPPATSYPVYPPAASSSAYPPFAPDYNTGRPAAAPYPPQPARRGGTGWIWATVAGVMLCACLAITCTGVAGVVILSSQNTTQATGPTKAATARTGTKRVADQDLLYTDPRNLYSVLWPEGWTLEERGNETLISSETVQLLIRPFTDGRSAESLVQDELASIKKSFRVSAETPLREAKVNGAAGKRIAAEYQDGNRVLSTTLYGLQPSRSNSYLIIITIVRDRITDSEGTVDRMISELRVR